MTHELTDGGETALGATMCKQVEGHLPVAPGRTIGGDLIEESKRELCPLGTLWAGWQTLGDPCVHRLISDHEHEAALGGLAQAGKQRELAFA